MNFIKIARIAAVAGFFTISLNISTSIVASSEEHASIIVKEAWARARTGKAKVGGAYMIVHNRGREDDRLISVRSNIAERTEIHTTNMTDGVMKMLRLKEGVDVKAGGTIMLEPGSYHVMLLGLKEPVIEGKKFPVTLVFKKAGEIEVMVFVKKAGAMGTMDHSKMKHKKMN
ncbi:MAG: copper chaperone PCu(A)C [Sneathiella sp.]|nr:copper chaperone PCu(A)C [Sneathiella sp.]